jgi:hypothetical protein
LQFSLDARPVAAADEQQRRCAGIGVGGQPPLAQQRACLGCRDAAGDGGIGIGGEIGGFAPGQGQSGRAL